jgi:IS5 family transposase
MVANFGFKIGRRAKRGSSDRGMGRSRGGLASKIHALVDADGRPVALRLTGGQAHDSQEAEALLEALPEGATLLADKGYDSNGCTACGGDLGRSGA